MQIPLLTLAKAYKIVTIQFNLPEHMANYVAPKRNIIIPENVF